MPRPPSRSRRLATAARWPLGVALTSWHYMWRTTPMHRREVLGTMPEDAAPDLPAEVVDEEVQPVEDGVGPLFHRLYRARLRETCLAPEELMARLASDPDQASPSEFATFQKLVGQKGRMQVGDEFVVRMPGPWDGPVRVVDLTPTAFRLATLQGHLEAGQIEFRARREGALAFEIESWARSGDWLSDLLYDHVRMAKEIQLHMWTSFIEKVAKLAGGRLDGGIEIVTRRVEEGGGRLLGDAEARSALDELHERTTNFDPAARGRLTPDRGWKVDDYCQPLSPEAPGDPMPDGSFEVARRLMRDYEFADPETIRAVYRPDDPLEGRDMLLEARFHGLRFHIGVRVAGVVDETRSLGGRDVRVWGWSYRTLTGHLEMGQMDYELWKWLDSGDVEFRIHVVSQASHIPNPAVRLGFRLFGRREQVRFARRACERVLRLTRAELDRAPRPRPVPRAVDHMTLRPSGTTGTR